MTENRFSQNPQIALAISDLRAGVRVEQNFRRVFEYYYKPLHGFFRRKNFSAEDAQELTQETFLRVFNKIEQYRGEAPFEAWLWQIAANTYRKKIAARDASKRSGATVSLDEESGEHFLPDESQATPLDDVLHGEQREQLRAAISELPEQMRKCISLRVFQDLSYQEIAVVLQISAQTVKAHLFQARGRLRARLGA